MRKKASFASRASVFSLFSYDATRRCTKPILFRRWAGRIVLHLYKVTQKVPGGQNPQEKHFKKCFKCLKLLVGARGFECAEGA